MRRRFLAAAAFLLLLAPAARAATDSVGWMIYPYALGALPEEQYQRFLSCAEAKYLGIQVACHPGYADESAKRRIAEVASRGKTTVLQIWWGSTPPFSWERYNFPNITFDPKVREEFFARVTDPLIDYLGPKNIFAAHLMEETGMQFGWDVDMPGRPDRDDDGMDNGSNWDNPANFPWGRSISGPNVLTIRRFNDIFRKQTGLDMRYAPVWSAADMNRYRSWVQENMEAGAHNEFARHVHRKYPGMRVYAFNSGVAVAAQSKVLDGHFIDPYTNTMGLYMSLRGCRTVMRPDQDLVAMTWGNREKPVDQRMPQQAACYIAGSNILSTFGDDELKDDAWLSTVRNSVRPFIGLPVFKSSPKVLVLPGQWSGATLSSVYFWITGFAHYDVCHGWAAPYVKLDNYDLVFAHAAWHPDIPAWVKKGGVLVSVRAPEDLLAAEGLLARTGKPGRKTLEYRPDAGMRAALGLKESYALDLDVATGYEVKKPEAVRADEVLQVAEVGKGFVVSTAAGCHVHAPWKYEPSWEPYRRFLTDICRGALSARGKKAVADEYFDDPALGNDYMKATSADGKHTVYILLNDTGAGPSATSFTVKGRDLVTGGTDVRFCRENPVVVVENRGGAR